MVGTGDSALEFELLVWIPDPRHRGRVESDLRERIVRQFRELRITIPFPQRHVRLIRAATPA
jgi:small-conductance mechanosensitive channel